MPQKCTRRFLTASTRLDRSSKVNATLAVFHASTFHRRRLALASCYTSHRRTGGGRESLSLGVTSAWNHNCSHVSGLIGPNRLKRNCSIIWSSCSSPQRHSRDCSKLWRIERKTKILCFSSYHTRPLYAPHPAGREAGEPSALFRTAT